MAYDHRKRSTLLRGQALPSPLMELNWKHLLIKAVWAFVTLWVFIGLVSISQLLLEIPNHIGLGIHHWVLILLLILIDAGVKRQLPSEQTDYELLSRFTRHFFPLTIAAGILLIAWEWSDLLWSENVAYITAMGYQLKWAVAALMIGGYVVVDIGTELLRKWRDSLADSERFQKENVQTRLDTLKSQINPHFLFNSLNTLSGLIHEDPEKASSFLRKISGVYRHILEARDKDLIPLEDELRIANDYIDLIHVRFEGSVEVLVEVEPTARSLRVVPLCLQMLMENAIKHNRASNEEPLHISIRTEAAQWLVVENNRQERRSLEVSTKVGLRNIKARLAHVTTRPMEVIENSERFTVRLPLITAR